MQYQVNTQFTFVKLAERTFADGHKYYYSCTLASQLVPIYRVAEFLENSGCRGVDVKEYFNCINFICEKPPQEAYKMLYDWYLQNHSEAILKEFAKAILSTNA